MDEPAHCLFCQDHRLGARPSHGGELVLQLVARNGPRHEAAQVEPLQQLTGYRAQLA
ncbi:MULTISPECIES: hypothetical protein [Sorangium]|uniref:hypothetical protein n=1 Tax=Sorangium TaxID=39643 RepID=UPI0013EB2686|nr:MULTISPECIES: hypothetical protein [Sorangium]